jgi:Reverse transcriptase (RNA-dependent DNA polymerase)
MYKLKLQTLIGRRKNTTDNFVNPKKIQKQEQRDQKLIHEAKAQCYKFLRVDSKLNYVANDISLSEWKNNFDRILNEQGINETGSLSLKEMLTEYPRQDDLNYFLEEEARIALKGMKNNKAPGPDSLRNETLKLFCEPLISEMTTFFNLCLKTGTFPTAWNVSELILLFKGKGDTADMNNFRGISLSCSMYNLLDRMMKNRLYAHLAEDIPKNQFGFVRGRSTIQAINQLITEIKLSVYDAKTPLYSLFLDVKKAFDSIDRKFIFQKLLDTKKLKFEELNLLAAFLEINFLNIWDKVGLSEPIVQSNGVKQGGSLSPLLFIFSLFNINDLLKDFPNIKLLIYADDIVIISKNLDDIQNFLNRLIAFLAERKLKLNPAKCKILKFRNKGRGRYKATDKLKIGNDDVEFVSDFVYLGVKFQASGLSFAKHIDKRIKAAIFATCKLISLPKASLDTALKIFDLAISPIASYGIEAIWSYLSLSDLHHLETVKTRFLKRALSLSKFIKSRYTYKLAETGYFIDDLRRKFSLPETESYKKFLTNQTFKNSCINPQFFDTPAMINQNWKTACFENRHVFTRFACHGFHYVLCNDKSYHASAHDACKCVKCGDKMDQYHFNKCDKNDMSLIEASKFCWKH